MFADEMMPGQSGVPFVPLERAVLEKDPVDISLYNIQELLSLRARIDALLPPMDLQHMDLEKELVIQNAVSKALQQQVIDDTGIESQKKAIVVNSCAASLATLARLQKDTYTSERFKTIEGYLIRQLRTLPKEAVDAFLVDYEAMNNG